MPQNRVLSYQDAHRYRLGINHHQIPVDHAKAAQVVDYRRDGAIRVDDDGDRHKSYPLGERGPKRPVVDNSR